MGRVTWAFVFCVAWCLACTARVGFFGKGDGTFDEQYERWVLGRRPKPPGRRWSVLKDVLGWIP